MGFTIISVMSFASGMVTASVFGRSWKVWVPCAGLAGLGVGIMGSLLGVVE